MRRHSSDRSRLERFKVAQDAADSGFESALREMTAGSKRGHWIWYIFPQLSGLGTSPFSQTFALEGRREAVEYLRDPILRARLLAITSTVAARVREGVSLTTLMGSRIDVLKLVSSLTLFERVAEEVFGVEREEDCQRLARAAREVLDLAESQGYLRCRFTLEELHVSAAD